MPKLMLIFERQWLHALLLALLLTLLVKASDFESVRAGQLGGFGTRVWFWTAVTLAVAH